MPDLLKKYSSYALCEKCYSDLLLSVNCTQGNTSRISLAELAALQIVSYIGCAVSIICLIATIIFFLAMG